MASHQRFWLVQHYIYISFIEVIVQKGPYLPCVSMAGRTLLAGYPRYISPCSIHLVSSLFVVLFVVMLVYFVYFCVCFTILLFRSRTIKKTFCPTYRMQIQILRASYSAVPLEHGPA